MLDSERLALECWREAALQIGAPIHETAILGMVGMHTSRTRQWLSEQFGSDYPADAMCVTCHEIYLRRTQYAAIPLRPGILEILDWLEEQNIPKVVATSTRRHLALHHLEMADLLHRFSFIICGDEITHPKPAPDIYLAAQERLGFPAKNCMVFEDSDFGALAAHSAGCQLIIVPDLRMPSPETQSLGAPIVESLHAAREHIEKRLKSAPV